jgi:outer membrane protein
VLPPGDAGFGISWRFENPAYRGADRRYDFLPIVLYDSPHFYLHSYRGGLKLEREGWRTELFVQRRFEGFASDDVPTSMVGMARRHFSTDVGVGASLRHGPGTAYAELLRDAGNASEGSEFILGYRYERWWEGRLRVRPYARLSWRDAKLNNYYYGVRAEEATAERPAYNAGAGFNTELGLQAVYRLTEQYQVLAGFAVSRASGEIRGSPVVDQGIVPSAMIGLLWSFAPQAAPMGERKPLLARFLYGSSSDCDLFPIVTLQCTSRHTQDNTSLWAFEVGERLVERLNGWPVDMSAYVGLLRHEDRGLQPDSWQVNAYLKAHYYGFPWRARLRTRLGFGTGLSYASRPPFSEARDQANRGRDTSKLLLYGDPSLDFSVGDLLSLRELRETYFGVGVSHRSGIFGWSRVFGNVAGGSNYIYGYVETRF